MSLAIDTQRHQQIISKDICLQKTSVIGTLCWWSLLRWQWHRHNTINLYDSSYLFKIQQLMLLLLCPLPLFLGQNSAYPNNGGNRFIHNTSTYHPNYLLSHYRNPKSVFSGLTTSARWQCQGMPKCNLPDHLYFLLSLCMLYSTDSRWMWIWGKKEW